MKRDLRRVRKEDFTRVILTETSPYEVPIIFSNFGLYEIVKKLQTQKLKFPEIYQFILNKSRDKLTIPHSYKIRKDENSFRTLSLMHPSVQIDCIQLYKSFNLQIINACSKSKFSIRSPIKIASKYYSKNENQNDFEFKTKKISLASQESKNRFLTSFFSYQGHTRLYKFFDSYDFLRLEKQFSSFWSLDISKFFDSIYTPTISWALKTKTFSKENFEPDNTLGSIFGQLMKSANYNDTVGILIGPEVSRVFAEVISQQIDRDVELILKKEGLQFGLEYEVRRYVDDIFIFSLNDTIANTVHSTYATALKKYKLNLNTTKTKKASRPFVTPKTRALRSAKLILNDLEKTLIYSQSESSESILPWTPKRVINQKHLTINFINGIKSSCMDDPESYLVICGFLISSLTNLLERFAKKNLAHDISSSFKKYETVFQILINLIFYFFTVNATHSGSVKLCKVTILSCAFFEKHFPYESDSVKSLIYTLSLEYFQSSSFQKTKSFSNDGYALLETLNVLAAVKELGENYLISKQDLSRIVDTSKNHKLNYFEIITLLYYIENNPSYLEIKRLIEHQVSLELDDILDIRSNSSKAYLFFDIITCPYISKTTKSSLLKKYYSLIHGSLPNDIQLNELLPEMESTTWFTSWDQTALLNILEKKELLKAY